MENQKSLPKEIQQTELRLNSNSQGKFSGRMDHSKILARGQSSSLVDFRSHSRASPSWFRHRPLVRSAKKDRSSAEGDGTSNFIPGIVGFNVFCFFN